ncbi:alpha/beta hydrolase [Streptomyces sp. SID10853]|uniref:alpha/beta hydrolase n=1 Tax=Streptomyces sp. SID10853 TaxID=2706028 RepID=UPI0013C07287|nr:alpha/beta hydrolase [Streptomyces sp. SID10853]NDZ80138.1 alpha/beta hydrolase [Streptomyces sp. SID10853]
MSDDAEADSVLGHPAVAPDATAAYGDHPDQTVDFYAPHGGEGPVPLVVVLHGGSWRQRYDRRHMSPFAAFLARRGFAVASVEYRRGGAAEGSAGRWPDTLDDVAAALDALPELVPSALPRADLRRTVLTGHSAGGHLALWAAARHVLPPEAPWHRSTPPFRGVVALSPLAHFGLARELGACEGAVDQFLAVPDAPAAAGASAVRAEWADPSALLPTGIATTVVQGRADTTVPPQIADAYADAAAKEGELVGVTLLDGVGHFAPVDPAADACAVVVAEIEQLAW